MARVVWFSNAPFTPTGYGTQTGYISATLPKFGHDLAIVCNYGLEGMPIPAGGYTMYPGGVDRTRESNLKHVAREFGADLVITLFDSWSFRFHKDKEFVWPWVAWEPVHASPHSHVAVRNLMQAHGIVAFSRFGERTLLEAGLEPSYIPHGVDTAFFCPGDGGRFGFGQETFIVGMIANNAFHPSRKALPEAVRAFSLFHKQHPNSRLYLHMRRDEGQAGIHMDSLITELGLHKDAIIFVDQGKYLIGMDPGIVREVYRSVDVLLHPSMAEGFGLPVLEAESCGIPVIATDCSSMTELVERAGGWLVKGQPWRGPHRDWWTMPNVGSIHAALESAFRAKQSEQWSLRRQAARHFAEGYDFERVVAPAWHTFIESGVWSYGTHESLSSD